MAGGADGGDGGELTLPGGSGGGVGGGGGDGGRAAGAGWLVEEAEPGVEEVYGEVAVMVVAAMALGYLERAAAVGAGLEGGRFWIG